MLEHAFVLVSRRLEPRSRAGPYTVCGVFYVSVYIIAYKRMCVLAHASHAFVLVVVSPECYFFIFLIVFFSTHTRDNNCLKIQYI